MFNLKKLLTRVAPGVLIIMMSTTSTQAAIINLGFSLDESGSVGSSNFNLTRDALADALAIIPTTGTNQYRLAVTTFSSIVTQVIAPTIVSAANIGALQTQLKATAYSGGGTATHSAISNLASLFSGFNTDLTLFNITTDGSPNSQSSAEGAALFAFNDYVDGISFEAVGGGINNTFALNNMARIAGLGTSGDATAGVVLASGDAIPDAAQTGFVIPVLTFADYEDAIKAKITQIVVDTTPGGSTPVPAPSAVSLLALGFAVMFARRAKKMSNY
ncbi:VWA domain-containing protein [Paraglaciecola aquimarina]|uniref:VWA domain-containing protein n=1 Tax=Paraglaciecola algarum TaxID=3050085 RepID=A0ABS9DBB2_9ALTE|nr:VWA domain-containing protein [Paraglaciecola sp. G1-23]MCF2950253.1 VWA domain-containing protein [Paraglaciecola sp. G1-23]